jgi:hypothetical protein
MIKLIDVNKSFENGEITTVPDQQVMGVNPISGPLTIN